MSSSNRVSFSIGSLWGTGTNARSLPNWVLVIFAALILMVLGCGSKPQNTVLDPLNLFADHQNSVSRHHPYNLVELDLGEYEVAIAIPDSVEQYRIGFQATAIAPRTTADKLKPRLEEYNTRIRDMILASAQTLTPNNITDPHQAWLKSEIIANLSKMLKTRDVRDVVFSNYNFERR